MYDFVRAYREKDKQLLLVRGAHHFKADKFFKEVDRVAGGLYSLGVRQGDVVMSALPNIEQGVIILYAVSALGAIFSPVHPLISPVEFGKEVKLQQPKVAFLSDINLFKFSSCLGGVKKVYCPFWAYVYAGLPYSRKYEKYEGNGEIPALYMHSGGTSGAPKTVALSAKAVNALVDELLNSAHYDYTEKDKMLATLPMFHGFGLIVGVHTAISVNVASVLLPKFNAEKATKVISKEKITTIIAIPRMLKKFLDDKNFVGDNIKTLENIYVGGDALNLEVAVAFDERLRESGAGGRIQQGYGLTEMGSVCSLSEKDGDKKSVGKPLVGVDAILLDKDENGIGELALASEQIMLGYIGQDSQPFIEKDGKRYLLTGDFFKMDNEGKLFFTGRKKRLIKISGMNVFPYEIERVACECGVENCVAVETFDGGKSGIVLVVEGEISEDKKEQILQSISLNLSHWHLPKKIVCCDKLPRTNIGKIDFRKVQNEYKQNC